MKKALSIFLSATILLLVLAGCGKTAETGEPGEDVVSGDAPRPESGLQLFFAPDDGAFEADGIIEVELAKDKWGDVEDFSELCVESDGFEVIEQIEEPDGSYIFRLKWDGSCEEPQIKVCALTSAGESVASSSLYGLVTEKGIFLSRVKDLYDAWTNYFHSCVEDGEWTEQEYDKAVMDWKLERQYGITETFIPSEDDGTADPSGPAYD